MKISECKEIMMSEMKKKLPAAVKDRSGCCPREIATEFTVYLHLALLEDKGKTQLQLLAT